MTSSSELRNSRSRVLVDEANRRFPPQNVERASVSIDVASIVSRIVFTHAPITIQFCSSTRSANRYTGDSPMERGTTISAILQTK